MQGVKHDQGKPMISEIPACAIIGMGKVLTFGAEKYGRHNWKKGIDKERLMDAALRHLYSYMDGQEEDKESGFSHLYHAMVNLSMLVYFNEKG